MTRRRLRSGFAFSLVLGLGACTAADQPLTLGDDALLTTSAQITDLGTVRETGNPSSHPSLLTRALDGHQTVMDFEELSPGSFFSYSLDGFTLTIDCGACTLGPGLYTLLTPANGSFWLGSQSLLLNDIRNLDAVLARDDGAPFSLSSIDIGPAFLAAFGPAEVTFVGTRANGSVVTHSYQGPAVAAFETVEPAGFDAVVEVRWTQLFPVGTHQFDNVVLEPCRGGKSARSAKSKKSHKSDKSDKSSKSKKSDKSKKSGKSAKSCK